MRIVCAVLLLSSVANADDKVPEDVWYPRISAGAGIGWRSGDFSILRANAASLTTQLEVKLVPAVFVGAMYEFARGTGRDEDMLVDDALLTTHTVGVAVRNP